METSTPEKVKEHYGDGQKFGVKIRYMQQDKPKGIAHAIGLCEEYANRSIEYTVKLK